MDANQQSASIGGMALAIGANLSSDVLHTMFMAVIGAVVSFTVSLILRCLYDKLMSKFKKKEPVKTNVVIKNRENGTVRQPKIK